MKIFITFRGTIGQDFFNDSSLTESVFEFPEGACVKDLFNRCKIPTDKGVVAILDGRVASPDEKLYDGMAVSLFHTAYGG